ncbi:MAG: glycosyltransferase [Reichenbachiella sp.]
MAQIKGKISVIMAAYNAEEFISEAIQSLLNQTYKEFELLICDDASTDKTVEQILSFQDERINVFKNNTNKGKPYTCNYLYEQASGEFVTIHDADDISLPLRFEKIVNKLNTCPEIAMCGHIIQRTTEQGRRLPLFRNKETDFSIIKSHMEVYNTDGDPSMIIRSAIIPKIGGLIREYFKSSMDYDLGLRIIGAYKTTNICEVLSLYRNHSSSISKSISGRHAVLSSKMAIAFYNQRIQGGQDYLQMQKSDEILALEEAFHKPYDEDPSKYHRDFTSKYISSGMYKLAIKTSVNGMILNPKIENLRTFIYSIRQYIWSKLILK